MKLRDIALLNMRRRKAKAAFVLVGLMIGVATVVALITLFQSVSHNILHKMEKYGANILVVPKSQNLSLSYGGISVGGVSLETREIRESDVGRITTIPTSRNVAAIGPVVLGAVHVAERDVMLAGVDFHVSRILKPWWEIGEATPPNGGLVVGSTAAKMLGARVGQPLEIDGRELMVSKVLSQTGSQDDQIVFTDTDTAQSILRKPGVVSMVEVAAHCMDCPIEDIINEISAALPNADVMAIKSLSLRGVIDRRAGRLSGGVRHHDGQRARTHHRDRHLPRHRLSPRTRDADRAARGRGDLDSGWDPRLRRGTGLFETGPAAVCGRPGGAAAHRSDAGSRGVRLFPDPGAGFQRLPGDVRLAVGPQRSASRAVARMVIHGQS